MEHSQHKGLTGGVRDRLYPESEPALLPEKKSGDGTSARRDKGLTAFSGKQHGAAKGNDPGDTPFVTTLPEGAHRRARRMG